MFKLVHLNIQLRFSFQQDRLKANGKRGGRAMTESREESGPEER